MTDPFGATSPAASGRTVIVPPGPRPGAMTTRCAPCPTSALVDSSAHADGAMVTTSSVASVVSENGDTLAASTGGDEMTTSGGFVTGAGTLAAAEIDATRATAAFGVAPETA